MAVVKTLKPSGGDYQTIAAFFAGEKANFEASPEMYYLDCYAFPLGLFESASHTMDWAGTTASAHVCIRGVDKFDYRDDSGFFVYSNLSTPMFNVAASHFFSVEDIGVKMGNHSCIATAVSVAITEPYITAKRCYLEVSSTIAIRAPIYANRRVTFDVQNCVLWNKAATQGGAAFSQDTRSSSVNDRLMNCMLYSPLGSAWYTQNNNVVISRIDNNVMWCDDLPLYPLQWGANQNNNATNKTSYPGTNPIVDLLTTDFVDFANLDFTPTDGGALDETGVDASAFFTDDYFGALRSVPGSVGNITPAGGVVTVKEMYTKQAGGSFAKATPQLRLNGSWQEVEAHVRSGGAWVKVHDVG